MEVEAPSRFLDLIDAADMVKFTKDGSTANTAAVKLARAFTGRDLVAICADHPFFSYDDWAMVTTPMRGGIPAGVDALTLTFRYNAISSVEDLLATLSGSRSRASCSSPNARTSSDGFLQRLRSSFTTTARCSFSTRT